MNFLGSKTLETNRLILRKTEESDLKTLWEILCNEAVSKYYLTSKINYNWEDEKKWQYKKLEHASDNDVFQWTIVLKDTNEVIGQINCLKVSEDELTRDVGWFIDPLYHKKGYAIEAATEMIKYMFLEVGINSIETSAAIVNSNSWMLMEKLGFKRQKETGYVKYTLLDDKIRTYKYKLTRLDFLKELFRKDELYIKEDIDKDPYIKHLSDDFVVNITGLTASGKTEATLPYLKDCDVVNLDEFDTNDFDKLYNDILDKYKNSYKTLILESNYFYKLKNISLLKGDIIIIRTCKTTCRRRNMARCSNNTEYTDNLDKLIHILNSFIDKIDKL